MSKDREFVAKMDAGGQFNGKNGKNGKNPRNARNPPTSPQVDRPAFAELLGAEGLDAVADSL